MHNPELYAKFNDLQKQVADEVLKASSAKFQWKESGDRIIDVGCGDGSLTTHVLKKYLPSNYCVLVGLDISEEVVRYAREKYGKKDSRLQFTVHDIQKTLPLELKENYDKVFSFHLFHFVPDNKTAFENMYQLLAPGGTCFLTFLAKSPLFDVYVHMARSDKWKFWLEDVEKFVSPYQFSEAPIEKLKGMLENAGFQNIEITLERQTNSFESVEYLKQLVKAINSFKLSEDLLIDFAMDFTRTGIESGLLSLVGGDGDQFPMRVEHTYDLFTAYAEK